LIVSIIANMFQNNDMISILKHILYFNKILLLLSQIVNEFCRTNKDIFAEFQLYSAQACQVLTGFASGRIVASLSLMKYRASFAPKVAHHFS